MFKSNFQASKKFSWWVAAVLWYVDMYKNIFEDGIYFFTAPQNAGLEVVEYFLRISTIVLAFLAYVFHIYKDVNNPH